MQAGSAVVSVTDISIAILWSIIAKCDSAMDHSGHGRRSDFAADLYSPAITYISSQRRGLLQRVCNDEDVSTKSLACGRGESGKVAKT